MNADSESNVKRAEQAAIEMNRQVARMLLFSIIWDEWEFMICNS